MKDANIAWQFHVMAGAVLEETARDPRTYLDGIPVGLIVTAYGWQATGRPTPFGAALNTSTGIFNGGICTDALVAGQLSLVGRQVVEFARLRLSDRGFGP
ncbi:MAG: hypothetical protein ABSC06_36120 [Rhodopila sp.]|jgi:FMN reductase